MQPGTIHSAGSCRWISNFDSPTNPEWGSAGLTAVGVVMMLV